MKTMLVVLLASIGTAAAQPRSPARRVSDPGAVPRELGNLVIDGIPEIPPALAERTLQYQNSRGALLADWHPSGKGILFRTRFGQTAQVHYVAAPGGDRQQWTFFNEPISGAWFDPERPDAGFYFAMDVGGGEVVQFYWFDRERGTHALLTDGTSRNMALAAANRGGRIAYSSSRRNAKDFDIYVQSGQTPAERVLEGSGYWAPIDWSPDDKQLLVKQYVSVTESYLHIVTLDGNKVSQVNPLGDTKVAYSDAVFARRGSGTYYASDEGAEFLRLTYYDLRTREKTVLTPDSRWDITSLAISDDGRHLAYVANEGGTSALYLGHAASNPAGLRPRKVALPPGEIVGLAFDPPGARLAITLGPADGPFDVYTVDVRSLRVTRWTTSEVGGLDSRKFIRPVLVEYSSFDGRKIPAWYYAPRGATSSKPVPVVIHIHGGPEEQATASFNPLLQFLTGELGVAVLEPNVRGSTGYGKTYVTLDNGLRREDAVKDIGALLDWISGQPSLDKSRVAVMGGSYGGYMVLAALVHYSHRLRAGIDIVGISNFVSFLQNTEDYRKDLRRVEYGDERDPTMREFLHQISPLTHAAKISAPLLVVQGANDPRVPRSEAEQIVATVRKNGGTVWYLLAKDEGHGFRKKANRDFYINAVALFLQETLLK